MTVSQKFGVSALLIAATVTLYWPTRQFSFIQYDDKTYVTENEHVRNGFSLERLRWAFCETYASNWHPLTWLSHMLDCELYGLEPGGHHLTNVGLHAANVVLLFLLLEFMTGYWGLIGVFIMLSWGGTCVCEAWRIGKWGAPLTAFAVILACTITSRREVGYWKNSETLFRRAIAVAKDTSAAHNDLGTVLAEQHRYEEAIYHFREALRIDPDHAPEHKNLGIMLTKQGQFEEAGVHFAQALRIEPNDPVVLKNLIAVLTLSGTLEDGKRRYKEAFNLQPDTARAARDIAWVLATHEQASVRDGVEAVRLAERAVELTGSQQPSMLDALAAAYAEMRRYVEAAGTAEAAIKLAAEAGDTELEAELRSRLELYARGIPYREVTRAVPP